MTDETIAQNQIAAISPLPLESATTVERKALENAGHTFLSHTLSTIESFAKHVGADITSEVKSILTKFEFHI